MDKTQAKKFLYTTLGIAGAILALAVFIVVKKKVDTKIIAINKNEVISPEEDKKLDAEIEKALNSIDFENFDTDQDGVPDWQEYIYGLNPASAETYGEGTSDKVFIENIESGSTSNVFDNMKVSNTELITGDMLKISGSIKTQEDVERVGAEMVQQIKNIELAPDLTKADIKYASDYKESYYNFIPVMSPPLINEDIYDFNTLFTAEEMDSDLLNTYKAKLDTNIKIIGDAVPPAAWVSTYLQVLNTLLEFRESLNYISGDKKDPLNTMAALSTIEDQYRKVISARRDMLKMIYEYIQKQ